MAKPICVIYYNPEIMQGGGMEKSNYEINHSMAKAMPDYYVFAIPQCGLGDDGNEPIIFKVFHEKDFTDIQYLELKKLIEESLPNYDKKVDLKGVI